MGGDIALILMNSPVLSERMAFLVSVAVLCLVASTNAYPTLVVQHTINIGTPISVAYDTSDGLDGRTMPTAGSQESNDWVGLFPAGECKNTPNNQDWNKCYVAWDRIPASMSKGHITFEAEHYKNAGEYEVRYFYGDDPTIPGALSWVGQGWVCNSYTDTTADTVREAYTIYEGAEGNPAIAGLTLNQCQCDSTITGDQTIDTVVTSQAECLSYRAACGRCALDAVATSNIVTVTGQSGVGNYQDTSSLPGFEIAF